MSAAGDSAPYPIEIAFPDLRPHAEGNCGISYLYQFDSGVPGPHVMVNALTHGNEVSGAIAVSDLLTLGCHPRRGRLTLCFANVGAYLSFDRSRPDASRFLDQDFNRLWTAEILDDASRDSRELRRARELRPVIDVADCLLDLHSMHERSEPLLLSGPLDKGIEFARALGAPRTIIVDQGHAEGCRLRDYDAYGDPRSARNALLVECGQHWEAASVAVTKDCVARFLWVSGSMDEHDLPAGWLRPTQSAQRVVRVTDVVVATSMDFRFTEAYTGLEVIADAGTVIAWSDGKPVETPYDDCMLVMPSLRQLRPGVTVVRFGLLED